MWGDARWIDTTTQKRAIRAPVLETSGGIRWKNKNITRKQVELSGKSSATMEGSTFEIGSSMFDSRHLPGARFGDPNLEHLMFNTHSGTLPWRPLKNETYRRFDTIFLFDESLWKKAGFSQWIRSNRAFPKSDFFSRCKKDFFPTRKRGVFLRRQSLQQAWPAPNIGQEGKPRMDTDEHGFLTVDKAERLFAVWEINLCHILTAPPM
jgi:hypothetical protein